MNLSTGEIHIPPWVLCQKQTEWVLVMLYLDLQAQERVKEKMLVALIIGQQFLLAMLVELNSGNCSYCQTRTFALTKGKSSGFQHLFGINLACAINCINGVEHKSKLATYPIGHVPGSRGKPQQFCQHIRSHLTWILQQQWWLVSFHILLFPQLPVRSRKQWVSLMCITGATGLVPWMAPEVLT